jgi:hypothetical protein
MATPPGTMHPFRRIQKKKKTNTLLCYSKEKMTTNQDKEFGKVTPNLFF